MTDSETKTDFEVIVIGAGISGIIAAQRYLDAHPDCQLALLEKDHCVGGVFGQRRLYDEFWTQWTVGVAEFSDMPMERPPETDCKNDCFKAKYTTKYLEKYVDQKRHDGRSLRDRIHFGVHVEFIEKVEGKWRITCTGSDGNSVTYIANKLMVANGENSLQNMPDLPGKGSFGGVILHSEDFGESKVISSENVKHIAVIGAGKSSADMIYEAVRAGKTVSWIIRKTGTGAGFFAPLDLRSPYKNTVEAAQTRIMSSLQPSLLNPDTWWTWFLHSTKFGVALVKRIFSAVDGTVRSRADYKGRKSSKAFQKLEYDTDIFWQNGTGGALHHDDFWNLVAEKVTVHRDDVTMLGDKTLYLKDGPHIPCDAVLCGTGWKLGLNFFDTDLLVKLDLPHGKEKDSYETTAKWEKLTMEADEKLRKKYPLLANPPAHFHKKIETTPYRLYNGIAPLSDDSILFMNHITAGNKLFVAEAQAIWAVAYFDKKITLPSIEAREKEIAAWVAWCRLRYLSNGERGNFAVFDVVPYIDKLLNDMGVSAHRKGWWRDLFEPFKPYDLGKAWREYLNQNQK
ncbi:flavin-binding monooxygenase-like family protein [Rutstroemia sp. NJR-2017a WRK4]|nr:flavin-binding monooxygenase-like family protein [Rutstroemia sp. NJR-2017a WRK4]